MVHVMLTGWHLGLIGPSLFLLHGYITDCNSDDKCLSLSVDVYQKWPGSEQTVPERHNVHFIKTVRVGY